MVQQREGEKGFHVFYQLLAYTIGRLSLSLSLSLSLCLSLSRSLSLIHTRTHAQAQAHARTHARTHTHAHTHTRTQAPVRWHAAKRGEHGAALPCRGFGERERRAPHGVASPPRPCRPCVRLPWRFAQALVEAGVQTVPSRAAAPTAPAVTAKTAAFAASSRTQSTHPTASPTASPQGARPAPH